MKAVYIKMRSFCPQYRRWGCAQRQLFTPTGVAVGIMTQALHL
jgi:hypothetical protein